MFSHATVRFADDRPTFEHDVEESGGHITLEYTTGPGGPAARLMVLSDEHPNGKRTIIAAYGIANFHLATMNEISTRFTGFTAADPDTHNSLPDRAKAGGVHVTVTLELGG